LPETVLPVASIGPFEVNTPFIDSANSGIGSGISQPHVQWLQSVEATINRSAQISPAIPASPTSPGSPGEEAYDGSYFYKCVAPDTWLRFAKDATWS